MLTSKIQYKASQEAAAELRKAILAPVKSDLPEKLVTANRRKLERKLANIEAEIEEFERNQTVSLDQICIESLEDMLIAPIRYRLAKKESVVQFAKEIGVDKRQVMRYEAEQYQNCSIPKLIEILSKIGLQIEGHFSAREHQTSQL